MKRDSLRSLKAFFLEFLVYTGLVLAYYFLVLHTLGNWLNHLFRENVQRYTGVALGLIILQGLVLEWVTRLLLGLIRPWMEKR